MRLLNEVVEHLLGVAEVGDDAVLHGADGDDVARCATDHLLGFLADSLHLVGDLIHGDDRGFIDDDPLTVGVHEGVRRAQVDREIV